MANTYVNKVVVGNDTVIDITDTTAQAEDVAEGKYFYDASGAKLQGTASGGGEPTHWTRPSEWPDYDSLDISDEKAMYLTYDLTLPDENCFCHYSVTRSKSTGSYVDIGIIEDGEYVVLDTINQGASGAFNYIDLLPYKSDYDYVSVRIRTDYPTVSMSWIRCCTGTAQKITHDGISIYVASQGLVEVYGNNPFGTGTPNGIYGGYSGLHYLKSFTMKNAMSTAGGGSSDNFINASFGSSRALENFYMSGTLSTKGTKMFQNCTSLKYIYFEDGVTFTAQSSMFEFCSFLKTLDLSKVTFTGSFENTFKDCSGLEKIVFKPNMSLNCTVSNMFNGCKLLKTIENMPTILAKSMTSMFQNAQSIDLVSILKKLTPTSNTTAVNNLAYISYPDVIDEIDISDWDLSSVTNAAYMFASLKVKKYVLPTSLNTLYNNFFDYNEAAVEYHFTSTTPPTMNSNVFRNMPASCIIYVPYSEDHSVLNAYKTASKWTTYASYIQEEPQ